MKWYIAIPSLLILGIMSHNLAVTHGGLSEGTYLAVAFLCGIGGVISWEWKW